jgi:hypothetical protein
MKKLIAIISLSLLGGCVSMDDLQSKVEKNSVCCKSFGEMKFEPLNQGGDTDLVLNEQSPVFVFTSGKSYFKAINLGNTPPAKITIWSNRTGAVAFETRKFAQVYCPSIQFLDEAHSPLEMTENTSLIWASRGFMSGNAFRSQFAVPKSARYAVFYTNPSSNGRISYMSIGPGVTMAGNVPIYSPGSSIPYPCGPVADAKINVR